MPGVKLESKLLEKHIQAGILHYLNTVPGCIAFQIYNGAVFDQRQGRFRANNNKFRPKGIPDIIGSLTGQIFGIEVKTPKGILSIEQIAMHDVLRSFKWKIKVCRCIQEAEDFIKAISSHMPKV